MYVSSYFDRFIPIQYSLFLVFDKENTYLYTKTCHITNNNIFILLGISESEICQIEKLTFRSNVKCELNAQPNRTASSSKDFMDANRAPSWAHILLKVGSALTVVVPTLLPLRSVVLKQEEPIGASQVYPGGHLGAFAVQK